MKARLYVRNPLDVNFVGEVEIPPFQVLPEILIWGQRFFRLAKRIGPGADLGLEHDTRPSYIEGCAWLVTEEANAAAGARLDASAEAVKDSLRAMVYGVGAGDGSAYDGRRLRAAALFNDDGPIFKVAHEAVEALKFLSTALAITSGSCDENTADPEFVAELDRISRMKPEDVAGAVADTIGGLRGLLRGTKWETVT